MSNMGTAAASAGSPLGEKSEEAVISSAERDQIQTNRGYRI